MSFKALAEAVANAKRDDFALGTVIRWTMRYELVDTDYRYAAIKTEAGWYTTAKPGGTVPQVMRFKQLLDIVSMPEAFGVQVATLWDWPTDSGRGETTTSATTSTLTARDAFNVICGVLDTHLTGGVVSPGKVRDLAHAIVDTLAPVDELDG